MVNSVKFMMVVVLLELMLIISLLMMKTLTNYEMGHTSLLFLLQYWRLFRAVFGGLTSNSFFASHLQTISNVLRMRLQDSSDANLITPVINIA